MDPSQLAGQFERPPGEAHGKCGGYDRPAFEGSTEIQVGGTDHLRGNRPLNHDQLRVREDLKGHAEPHVKAAAMGQIPRNKISFEGSTDAEVGGYDHINKPAFQHDELRVKGDLKGHVEPWLKKELMPEMHRDKIEYEGSFAVDVAGRDHFGAGGQGGNWVAGNYKEKAPPKDMKEYNERTKGRTSFQPGQATPNDPTMRFARGEKVTPFHTKRAVKRRETGTGGWDMLKHLPGHTDSRPTFDSIGKSNMAQTVFHNGFNRRQQSDIRQDAQRISNEATKDVKDTSQAAMRKNFIRDNQDQNTYNPITGNYYGKPGNKAFQEMITKSEGAQLQDRYRHHVKRRIGGPLDNGECSDCKPIDMGRREMLVREGCSKAKAATRGCVKDIFKHHDGYERALVAALPNIPKSAQRSQDVEARSASKKDGSAIKARP